MTPMAAAVTGRATSSSGKAKGRGVTEHDENNGSICVCQRDKYTVFCRACGFIILGRIRRNCFQHPRVIFLHDLTACPKCRANTFMLDEIKR